MQSATAVRCVVAAIGLDHTAFAVAIVRSHPVAEAMEGAVLLSAFGHHVEYPVGSEEILAAAAEARVGEIVLAVLVLEQHAPAGEISEARGPLGRAAEIIERTAGGHLLGCKGHVEIVVEVRAV